MARIKRVVAGAGDVFGLELYLTSRADHTCCGIKGTAGGDDGDKDPRLNCRTEVPCTGMRRRVGVVGREWGLCLVWG